MFEEAQESELYQLSEAASSYHRFSTNKHPSVNPRGSILEDSPSSNLKESQMDEQARMKSSLIDKVLSEKPSAEITFGDLTSSQCSDFSQSVSLA